MAARSRTDQMLPVAIATHGGLLAALLTLLIGTMQGVRVWILLVRAGVVFLVVSSLLQLISAAVVQGVRWKATRKDPAEDVADTVHTIQMSSQPPDTPEKARS